MLITFLALFVLLGALSTAAALGFFPALPTREGRLLPAWARLQRARLQAPPGSRTWRGSPDAGPAPLV